MKTTHTIHTLMAHVMAVVMAAGDDYYKVRTGVTTQRVQADPFVMCSFIDPDKEELSFPMAWTSVAWHHHEGPHPFDMFIQWVNETLAPVIADTRGDACLYQTGWVVILSDGQEILTINFQYWQKD